jgi:hypothetical protein
MANMLVARIAEDEFERRYAKVMQGQEFTFADHRFEGTDTDFLVVDGRKRPAFRMNIKAHGTFFERAQMFVGLEPEDTYALATYKVRQAVRKSQAEALPFLFAIVSSKRLTSAPLADALPEEVRLVADTSTLYTGLTGWERIEDRVVTHLIDVHGDDELVSDLRAAASEANWRVISAIKANRLMNQLLDQRVPAVSNPRFKVAPNSQPNMHFSLSQDMIDLDELLVKLRDDGIQHVATKIAYHEI